MLGLWFLSLAWEGSMQPEHLMVHRRYRFVACLIPKAGCSTWLAYLRAMTGGAATGSVYDHAPSADVAWWEQLSTEEWRRILDNATFTRFTVVRHPWDRLVSAFRSKVEGWCDHRRRCLRRVFGLTALSAAGGVVTFDEFVQAVASSRPEMLNAHFRPAHLLCGLQRLRYDRVIDLRDAAAAASLAQVLGFRESMAAWASRQRILSKYDVSRYYAGRTHAVHNCSAKTVQAASRVFTVDAKVLGYSWAAARAACTTHGVTSWPPP